MKKLIKNLSWCTLALAALAFSSCNEDTNGGDNGTASNEPNAADFRGEFSESITLLEGRTYRLTGAVIMNEGATLNIQPGVTIEAVEGSSATETFIAIKQGAKINAVGTATNPIVFTSEVKTPGSWGGIVICGRAPSNKGASLQAEVTGLVYGGNVTNDNSGKLIYARIEYTGSKLGGTKEFNGLNLFGVGNGTELDFIQVYEGSDDAFEFFGGTVNANHLVATNTEDDAFDWVEGWNGTAEFLYASNTAAKASDDSRGIEADNLESNNDASPRSNPTLRNISVVGRTNAPNTGEQKEGFKIRRGTYVTIENAVIANYSTGVSVDNDASLNAIPTNLSINGLKFINVGTDFIGKDNSGASISITAISIGTPAANAAANGAGNGASKPSWANGWTL